MAEGQALPGPSLVSLDEHEANPSVAKSERRSSSDAGHQVTATILATTGDREDEDDLKFSRPDAEERDSHVVELGDRPDPPANSAPNSATLWARLQTGWSEIEDQLAEWFGLNQSKYQWAVDELLERQLAGDHQDASKAAVEGLQMQDIQEQTMQRDSKGISIGG
ncbi:hypothetical protein M758_5G112900 [Ceratodon purpureus]|nr:hypothetical protein M758_5G112900 [Ceratodon purpureus]